MRYVSSLVLVALMISAPSLVLACGQAPVETAFDDAAPTASSILAVQVISLSLKPDSTPGMQDIRGQIRVLEHYRGSADFTELEYSVHMCAGLRLDVGGIYLIATSAPPPTIELISSDAPILHISSVVFVDPATILRGDHTIKQLAAALRGERDFRITTLMNRSRMTYVTPPPPVPLPEEFKD